MSTFKSFNPKKYSTNKSTNHKEMTEYCSSCGYDFGALYDENCPRSKTREYMIIK